MDVCKASEQFKHSGDTIFDRMEHWVTLLMVTHRCWEHSDSNSFWLVTVLWYGPDLLHNTNRVQPNMWAEFYCWSLLEFLLHMMAVCSLLQLWLVVRFDVTSLMFVTMQPHIKWADEEGRGTNWTTQTCIRPNYDKRRINHISPCGILQVSGIYSLPEIRV